MRCNENLLHINSAFTKSAIQLLNLIFQQFYYTFKLPVRDT